MTIAYGYRRWTTYYSTRTHFKVVHYETHQHKCRPGTPQHSCVVHRQNPCRIPWAECTQSHRWLLLGNRHLIHYLQDDDRNARTSVESDTMRRCMGPGCLVFHTYYLSQRQNPPSLSLQQTRFYRQYYTYLHCHRQFLCLCGCLQDPREAVREGRETNRVHTCRNAPNFAHAHCSQDLLG